MNIQQPRVGIPLGKVEIDGVEHDVQISNDYLRFLNEVRAKVNDPTAVSLSGGVNPISVGDTTLPGTLIHKATSSTSSWDAVYLWVSNITGAPATLTVTWGSGVLVSDLSVPANSGPTVVSDGIRINGGAEIRAYSDTGAALNITGNVNRIQ